MSENQSLVWVCPRCGSTRVQLQGYRKFSWGKAAIGSVLAGPIAGAALGATGKDAVKGICQNCGFTGALKRPR